MKRLLTTAIAAIPFALPAFAQDTVTVTITGVNDTRGLVRVGLCDGKQGQFPGSCRTYQGVAEAGAAETIISIPDVAPGAYALWAFHDANSNATLDFPAEGYGYGNNAPYPPSFDAALINVQGPTRTHAALTYPNDPAMVTTIAGTVRMGSAGAPAPAGVTKVDVRDDGLYAELYAPTGKSNLPALILVGGSEGGLLYSSRLAQSFTRQGYAVLALAYFAELGLPRTLESVPLEYFDKAITWLKKRPEVDAAKIGAIGGSRGSEAVLLMAARNPDIKAVMAFAPSGLVQKGIDPQDIMRQKSAWSADGVDLPFVKLDFSKARPGGVSLDMYIPGLKAEPSAEIAVEKIMGPILLISGEDDQLWPSFPLANLITERLASKGFNYHFEHLSYAGAGHSVFLGDPSGMSRPASRTKPSSQLGFSLGGTPEGDYDAWTDNWPRTLDFFNNALKAR